MEIGTLIIIGVVVVIVLYVWSAYNSLATDGVRIKEALSGIDVQLKRRIDLIPNLIETVKGYAKHEKQLLEELTNARTSLINAKTPHEKAESDNVFSGALKSLFAVSENYPNLKASDNFKQLQDELSDTENKIAYSRQFYNTNVRDYNAILVNFPSGAIGRFFGFKDMEFFEASDEERKSIKVSF
ncbi:MAG: hypothetical protein A3F31_01825 [Candidatus Levybacteria bacterium RIFCSPHIGHO2_12_FULL_38_12]|nr:MAG: hypothetical protein A2770_00710 [Candidatus Levybacteria bacterium RIFCSPHIGHO2_01_FULL_38_12]OGH22417.1 MAG: hypothetical protein A3D75_00030 [Candidatus Levybacteria bacterium RIFCSPHIGHO2_02_FULL_37_18]OGH23382.1 MAG: hypothetical protein A3F31_01825 [Candidatus Levybacteria bacterium RIFCSPHIGHO2_12_FULL_38_12]OGH34891.1 MAG: hypothetical protein A3A47_00405 [Candidatus Levybacteria bacterium RIFCSPLOWO2_01_FULL_37_20]OGH43633.1 MAG: hypothetical protein A3J14_02800 [Candidatus Lev